MPKRSRDDDTELRISKRVRSTSEDNLSKLSDELLLRVLSFLPITDLNICQCISHKFKAIAADSQLWKALYYNRFVRPRASRLPGMRDADTAPGHLYFSSKLSKWLDDDNLVKRGQDTNWKKQYKLRNNWTKGNCNVSEIEVAEQPPIPPLLVRMHEGIVYTADVTGGLRAWLSKKKAQKMLGSIDFGTNSPPTAMALDVSAGDTDCHRVAIGFEDGAFNVYTFDRQAEKFSGNYSHVPSSNGMLSAVAYCSPYLVTMTASQLLSLYQFPRIPKAANLLDPPRLLHSLLSHTVYPPLSLAIRSSSQNIVATIAFAFPSYPSGWSVGIQELWLAPDGALLDSRLAMSSGNSQPAPQPNPAVSPARTSSPFSAASVGYSKPTSLSYSHPYLLLSHSDNTLTLYLVTSSDKVLSIGTGSRLWGHTSSVSGAHVGGRGKAVSVSSRGDELRIWELEGTNRRKLASSDLSVRVQGENFPVTTSVEHLNGAITRRASGLGLEVRDLEDLSVVRGWVGFDEENVVVLKERGAGSQSLVVYDFT
ncbi:F-box domain cyclin-like protein [Venturia nashicola]|uniref:F-box domain cyclin-like protein n=1 Tax=Venturia nashicola TaxID=86259 RepID=A0A4Z1NZK3_9PEZI|nr:F-box domain cyclin-like protein [Venturia nashicola]TLD32083.1 F-box domain cyclin-like protein [Venturia nashicola]